MSQYSFLDDYSEGCHPQILEAMAASNLIQHTAYGEDAYSVKARTLIQQHLSDANTPVYFVASGTLANLIIVSAALRPHESVISAVSGHINLRETGAIEATGHKIISVTSDDGKLSVDAINQALAIHSHFPHMTRPRLVYLSNATETGTIYTLEELSQISILCKQRNLLLMLDGARLGAALTAEKNDLTLQTISELVDVFWIGGTKAGALIGEAIAIPNTEIAHDFAFNLKQKGALLAKGRVLGLQFMELFADDLFFTLGRRSNTLAQKLARGIVEQGYALSSKTESNQVFAILPNTKIKMLEQKFSFYLWEKLEEDKSVVRLVTSWATEESQVDEFLKEMQFIG